MYFKFLIFISFIGFVHAQNHEEMFPDVKFELQRRDIIHALSFMPSAGNFIFQTQIKNSSEKIDWTETSPENRTAESTIIALKYSYGLSDRLTLFSQIDYKASHTVNYNFSSGVLETYKERGMSDATFGLKWRIFYQDTYPFYLDLEAGFAPQQGAAKRGGEASPGNNLQGGSSSYGKLIFSRQFSAYEYQFFISYKKYEDYLERDASFNEVNFEGYTKMQYGTVGQYEGFKNAFAQIGVQKNTYKDEHFSTNGSYLYASQSTTELWFKFGSTIYQEQLTLMHGLNYETGKGFFQKSGSEYEGDITNLSYTFDIIIGNFH